MSEQKQKFYLTTPIYYVNARPHIGHAYTTIVADVLARRHRLLGDDTFFLTGTDEHGQKIERSAAAAGIPPQQFADQVSRQFRDLWDRMGLTYDGYIRTTDEKHKRGAQKLFTELYNNGFIYLDSYTGAYCVSDEAFVDLPVGTPCPDCGRLLEQVTEENFFFKLSEFQLPLLNLIESGELKIENEARRNEVLSFLRGNTLAASLADVGVLNEARSAGSKNVADVDKNSASSILSTLSVQHTAARQPYVPGALKDLSVSRSSFTWGIPVPEPAASLAALKHVIYVWLDALANYMTAIGYGSDKPVDEEEFKKFWPADLHLVGKEIIRFHCVYWPAFLLALNPKLRHKPNEPIPILSPEEHAEWAKQWLPKAITAHGWLLFDNSKMSKSKGNIVCTETILEAFGTLCPPSFTGLEEGFSPPSTKPLEKGALAPGFSAPTKTERDLFASDILRYFLLREIPFGQDGSFSFDAMITRYNADLANGYGNLVSRTLTLVQSNFDGLIPPAPNSYLIQVTRLGTDDAEDAFQQGTAEIVTNIETVRDACGKLMDVCSFSQALANPMMNIASIDQYISNQAPWKLAKQPDEISRAKLAEVLYTAAETIRIVTAQLYPVLPYATAKVWSQLGLGDIELAARNGELKNLQWGGLKPGTKLGALGPIFPRADKGLAQIMIDMENPEAANQASTRPAEPLKSAATPAPTAHVSSDPTHPAAPPRPLDEPSGTLPVAGSDAVTTERVHTPHGEAQASGVFASEAAKTPVTAGPSDASPQITIDDFAKVELRVAQIIVCERIPKADKLLRLEVDLGYEKRQILSGIAEWYTPEDLIGRRIVVITNLAPRKMRGLESHGMLLAASEEGGKPVLATFGEDIALGARLK